MRFITQSISLRCTPSRFLMVSAVSKSGYLLTSLRHASLPSQGQPPLPEGLAARGFTHATASFSSDLLSRLESSLTSASTTPQTKELQGSSTAHSPSGKEEPPQVVPPPPAEQTDPIGQQMIDEAEAGIETSPARDVSIAADLHGPWLLMGESAPPALQSGELYVDVDGFVFYRPTNGLGHGIGRLELISPPEAIIEEDAAAAKSIRDTAPWNTTAFKLSIEIYQFEQGDRTVSRHGTRFQISGVCNRVISKQTDYNTFSLLGAWEKLEPPETSGASLEEDPSGKTQAFAPAGPFHAAKIMPWDKSQQEKPWEPNEKITEAFREVFPQTLHLGRLQKGDGAAGNSTAAKEPKSVSSFSFSSLPHHLDLRPYRIAADKVSDLFYVPNYFTEGEQNDITQRVQSTPQEFKSKLTKRTCQEWGCTMCDQCQKSFVPDMNAPQWVQQVMDCLLHDGIFTPTTFPNSVRIHEYEAEEGIGPHCDGPIYVPVVAVLSAASTSVMHFYSRTPLPEDPMSHYQDTFKFKSGEIGSRPPVFSAVLEPGSLLIFASDCYYAHPHGIPDDKVVDLRGVEVVNEHLLSDAGKKMASSEVVRSYRVSVTVRHLLSRCQDQPNRTAYAMKRAWYTYYHQPIPKQLFTVVDEVSSPTASVGEALSGDIPPASRLKALEQKLDLCLSQQGSLKNELREVKELLVGLTASSSHYQKETSTILNHLCTTLLDMHTKTDELAADLTKESQETAAIRWVEDDKSSSS